MPHRRGFIQLLTAAACAAPAFPAYAASQDPPHGCPPRPHGGAPFMPAADTRPSAPRKAYSACSPEEIAQVRAAFAAMRALPREDPRSWIAQADLHASYCRQCENSAAQVHGSWSFLPWHRAFLYYYERILGSLMGNSNGFRLPYWDWENERTLPQAFVTPPNAGNALWDDQRNPALLAGGALPPTDAVSARVALLESITDFATFGGTGVSGGAFEIDPHNALHADIGRQEPPWTDMGNLGFSARDPLFFAHHANIDRLWSRWNTAEKNPPDETFRALRWTFYDEHAQRVSISAGDVLDHAKHLRYTYTGSDNAILPTPLRTTHACRIACCSHGGALLEAEAAVKAHVLEAARRGSSVALVLPRLKIPSIFSGSFNVIAYGDGRRTALGNLILANDGMLMRGTRRTALVLDVTAALEDLAAAKNPARIFAISRYGGEPFVFETQVAELRVV